MEWISVNNRLPEHLQEVDIWYKHDKLGGGRVADVVYDKENELFSSECGSEWGLNDDDGMVTHWMIPEPPKED